MGNDCCVASFLCHLDCVECFGQCTDLVNLDEDRIGNAKVDTLLEVCGVCNEQVVTNQLDTAAETLCELLPAIPVILCQTIFDGDQRILVDPALVHVDHLFAGLLTFAGTCENVLLLLFIIEFRGSRIHCEADVITELVAGSLYSLNHESQRAFVSELLQGSLAARYAGRRISAFVTNSCVVSILLENGLQSVEYFCTHADRFADSLCADRHDHVFLAVRCGIRMLAAVENVHHRNRENLCVCTADVLIKRHSIIVRRSTCTGQGYSECSVCAELGLERCSVEIDHDLVDFALACNIKAEDLRSDNLVDVADSLQSSSSKETLLVTVTEFKSFAFTGGCARRNDGTSKRAGLCGNLCFYCRVAAGVDYFTCINTYDIRH